nr:hypothetical protein [Tanacetum cinerariifolium]
MSTEIQKKEKLLQQEQRAYLSTHPSKRLTSFCYDDDDDDEDYTSAITPNEPVLSTKEPDNSLCMGDEHLDTILATESDKIIKSTVENLIPIPSESEGILEHMCDVPVHDNSPPLDVSKVKLRISPSLTMKFLRLMTILSLLTKSTMLRHHLSILSSSAQSDDQSCSEEDVLEKIIDSLLEEFAGELTLLKSIPPESDETDCDFEEDIRLIEKLLYDNSSLRPLKEFVFANSDATTESFSPSPIPIKDSDSLMEEMDLFCTPDCPMPSGIEDEDSDSEKDILIPKDLPSNNSLLFAKK